MKESTSSVKCVTMLLISITATYTVDAQNQTGSSKDNGAVDLSAAASDLWLEGVDVVRIFWRECSKAITDKNKTTDVNQDSFTTLSKCVKRKSLAVLDRTLGADVVSLSPGVHLVKYEQMNENGKIVKPRDQSERDDENGEWPYLVLNRLAGVFSTHVLKFDLNDAQGGVVESRHRRRHQMMQMMMFGIMSMGMILVPMGFQFLAVLGGKALLLAKLALILSSIQGLKKIATSPLNYGLYQAHQPFEGHVEKRANTLPEWSRPPTAPVRPLKRSLYNVAYASIPIGGGQYQPYQYQQHHQQQQQPFVVHPNEPSYVTPSDGDFYPATEMHAEYTIDLPVNNVHFKNAR